VDQILSLRLVHLKMIVVLEVQRLVRIQIDLDERFDAESREPRRLVVQEIVSPRWCGDSHDYFVDLLLDRFQRRRFRIVGIE